MDVIPAILDMSHTLDLFRCYWPSKMEPELNEMNQYYMKNKNTRDLWELAKFSQKAVKVTGDRLMTEFSESFTQRGAEFSINDFQSMTYRNFHLTDPTAFINCSTDFHYCWGQLQKLRPPIFYSQGETTFSYLNSSMNNPSLQDQHHRSTQSALDIIAGGNAAIRLVNTDPNKFGFEMTMINDPVFFRPLRATHGERNYVVSDRKEGSITNRGFQSRVPLKDQQQVVASDKLWQPVYKDEDRGLPKRTEYTKKLSLSLLRPDGKVKHFTGEFPNEYFTYLPVGFLYDVNELHQKNQKYVFDFDVGTSSKFWIGESAHENLKLKEGRETNLTLKDLQDKLKQEADAELDVSNPSFHKMQHASNEILMCPKKSAIRAIFATEDTPKARMRTLLHAVYLDQDYGTRVPVLVVNGDSPPRAYTQEQLKGDLEILSTELPFFSSARIMKDLSSCFLSEADFSKMKSSELNEALHDRYSSYLESQG